MVVIKGMFPDAPRNNRHQGVGDESGSHKNDVHLRNKISAMNIGSVNEEAKPETGDAAADQEQPYCSRYQHDQH